MYWVMIEKVIDLSMHNNNAYYHATFTPPHATLCPTFLEDR